MPIPARIFETVIYCDDLAEAKRFYTEVLKLPLHMEADEFIVFRLAHSALLIFDRKQSIKEGRDVPRHGTEGPGHVAFAATAEDFDYWMHRFEELEIPIDQIVDWPVGGKSVYIRDPFGNSVEFAPATLWGGNWNFEET
ncbi:MAG: VOC family protein [Verrucomicrobiae bacterium]|nr:VOC family protein [Verrucomicrobiae bacterium]